MIATDSGGPFDIVDNSSGILVLKKDSQALAEAIDFMINHHEDYSSVEIAKRAQWKYSLSSIGNTLNLIYRDIINSKRHNT